MRSLRLSILIPSLLHNRVNSLMRVNHPNDIIVCADFSENYAFVIQDTFLKHALGFFPVTIMYFSDGASLQYKNQKKFHQLMQSPS